MVGTTALVGEGLFVAGSPTQLAAIAGVVGGVGLAALAVRRDARVLADEERSGAARLGF